jgi:hypothetical protein
MRRDEMGGKEKKGLAMDCLQRIIRESFQFQVAYQFLASQCI